MKQESYEEQIRRYNQMLLQMQHRAREVRDAAPCEPGEPEVMEPFLQMPQPALEVIAPAASAIRMAEKPASQTVGASGPVLLQDSLLHETLERFVYDEPIGRVVHTKGYGARGFFTPSRSMRDYTTAQFLQSPQRRTPTFTRFSLAVSNRGTPDTSRNVRGFATKFYTEDGIFDLVGNHIPVFFVQDAIRFPETIAALSPSPRSNLAEPGRFWRFVADNSETMHMLLWLYSDIGTVGSFAGMRGYGVNTFVWQNEQGERRLVKYHWRPVAEAAPLTRMEAMQLACEKPDYSGRELYERLARGERVEYLLFVQLMTPHEAAGLDYDPLDDTKRWCEETFPLIEVGRLTLTENPSDYRAEVEQIAYSPANLVEGIALSADRMLQGRSFLYWDAQRRRLGADFRELPINRSPEMALVSSGCGEKFCGEVGRLPLGRGNDYSQAGDFYRALCETEQEHLADNIAVELYTIALDTQNRVLAHLEQCDRELVQRVQIRMAYYVANAR